MAKAMQVLIVEDEAIPALEMKVELEAAGFHVLEIVDNGRKAIEVAADNSLDVVIMDVNLKGRMDGIESAQMIYSLLNTPVVFVTAHSNEIAARQSEIAATFNLVPTVLAKPVDIKSLIAALTGAIENHSELQSRSRKLVSDSRDLVFVSYAHEDLNWLESLRPHLKALKRDGRKIWIDESIQPGDLLKREILNAISRSRVAVLLVSAHYLASDFIRDCELPELLNAKESGCVILPVIVSPCRYKKTRELNSILALNPPSQSLSSKSSSDIDTFWVRLTDRIDSIFGS